MLRDFLDDKSKFPVELIFLGRTMRMMQNLNQGFGSPVNRVTILTNELIDAVLFDSRKRAHVVSLEYWETVFKYLPVRIVIFFNNLAFAMVRIRQILLGDKYGGKNIGLEDYIEMYMKNTAKSLGLEIDY